MPQGGIVANQDQQPVSSRNRSRHQQEQQIVRLQARTKELEEENRSLRATLRLMGGLAEVRARKIDPDDFAGIFENGELMVPLITPENWTVNEFGQNVEKQGSTQFVIVKVSRQKKGMKPHATDEDRS
jgi:hypothetical protein